MSLPKFKLNTTPVLPAVYDESLSYYEELNKIKWYINALIDEIGVASGMFEEINRKIEELEEAVEAIEAQIAGELYYKVGDTALLTRVIASGYCDGVLVGSEIEFTVELPKKLPTGTKATITNGHVSVWASATYSELNHEYALDPDHASITNWTVGYNSENKALYYSSVTILADRKTLDIVIKRQSDANLPMSAEQPVTVELIPFAITIEADEE